MHGGLVGGGGLAEGGGWGGSVYGWGGGIRKHVAWAER